MDLNDQHYDQPYVEAERVLFEAVHEAPDLATVASIGTTLPAYLDRGVRREFRKAVRERYHALTQPGAADGPP